MTPRPSTATPDRHAVAYPEMTPRRRPDEGYTDTPWPYLAVLRRRYRLLIALPLTLSVIAVGLSVLRPRSYGARAAFLAAEPSSLNNSLGALSSVASQLGIPALSAAASNSGSLSALFYADLLKSNALLEAVVTTRYDATSPGEKGGPPFAGTLIDYLNPNGATATDRKIYAMRAFSTRILSVAVDRPTGVVRFEVRTKNRQLSELVARRLLTLVNDFNLRRRQTQAGAEREFTALRARAAAETLQAAEGALARFRSTNIDFSRSPTLGTRDAELARRVTLAQQIYTTVAQRYEMANIEAVRNTPVVTVLDAPEGLVEARSRKTAQIGLGVFAFGVLLACVIALTSERMAQPR
jgi:uncharacterized protein involved in exopolysaccharide biosynthesis